MWIDNSAAKAGLPSLNPLFFYQLEPFLDVERMVRCVMKTFICQLQIEYNRVWRVDFLKESLPGRILLERN